MDKGVIAGETEKAQKVEVKEDGFLYIDDVKQEGLHVGTDVIIKDASNGVYTITIGKDTIQLPMATSSLWATIVTSDLITYDDKKGIWWGKAAAAVDWKGPKGAIAENQFLVGCTPTAIVSVLPANVDLSSKKLTLVNSIGKNAPVIVTATAIENDQPINSGNRAITNAGAWKISIALDDTVNGDNAGKAFTTGGDDPKNVKYALAVDGAVISDYKIIIDTEKTAILTASVHAGKFKVKDNTDNGVVWTASSITTELKAPVGSYTFSFIGDGTNEDYRGIVDGYISVVDEDEAESLGISFNGMTVTASDKAGGKTISVVLHILDVAGGAYQTNAKIKFGNSAVEGEEISAQTYVAMPKTDVVIDLGTVFTGMSAADANTIANASSTPANNFVWSSDGNFFKKAITASNVTYFKDAECTKEVTDLANATTIRTIKYAKFADDELIAKAKVGDTKLTLTLKGNDGNEVKKVSTTLTVKTPTFDDFFVANSHALWNEGVFTTRMDVTATNPAINLASGFISVKDANNNPLTANGVNDITFKVVYKDANGNDVTVNTPTTDINALIANNKLKANEFTVTASVQALTGTQENFYVSKSYSMKLMTVFEGAKLVYYVNDEAQAYAQVGADSYIAPYVAKDKLGLALEFNGSKVAVAGKDFTVANITVSAQDGTLSAPGSAATVNAQYSLEEGSKGTLARPSGANTTANPNKGAKITDINVNESGVLVITFMDKASIKTSASIEYRK